MGRFLNGKIKSNHLCLDYYQFLELLLVNVVEILIYHAWKYSDKVEAVGGNTVRYQRLSIFKI